MRRFTLPICPKIYLFVPDKNDWLFGSEQKSCLRLSTILSKSPAPYSMPLNIQNTGTRRENAKKKRKMSKKSQNYHPVLITCPLQPAPRIPVTDAVQWNFLYDTQKSLSSWPQTRNSEIFHKIISTCKSFHFFKRGKAGPSTRPKNTIHACVRISFLSSIEIILKIQSYIP